MYSQVTQMQEAGLFPARPDFTITSPLLRPFQTCTLTQGITPDEMASGMSQSRTLVAPVSLAPLRYSFADCCASADLIGCTGATVTRRYKSHRWHPLRLVLGS